MNNILNIYFLVFYILFILCGCFSTAPSWVEERPIDKEYFHGIGYGSSNESNNPKRLARDNAINEIGSQIKINISSAMDIVVKDFNGSVDNAITSVIQSRVDLLLPELEFMGQYKVNDGIYYYVRLNKVRYKEAMGLLLENAKNTALEQIKLAEKNYSVGSFILIQKAWEEILPFNDEPIWVTYEGERISLYSLIKRKANEYINRIGYQSQSQINEMRSYVDRDKIIALKVFDNKSGSPLSGFPIKVLYPDSIFSIYSNSNGIIQYPFQDIGKSSTIAIKYIFDQNKLYEDLEQSDLILPLYPKTFSQTIKVVPAKAKIVSLEKNLNYVMDQNLIAPAIKESLNRKIEFVKDNPDIEININANTYKKSERIDSNYPYFSYGRASITFVDYNTNEEFFSANVSDIKGGDFSSQKIAGIRAYDEMVKQLKSKIESSFSNR